MKEYIVSLPAQEELDFQFRGVDWQEYRNLTDDEATILNAAHEEFRLEVCKDNDAFLDAYDAINMFHNFIKWRKYGVPDRNVTQDEVNEHILQLIGERGHLDMETGAFKEPILDDMTQEQRNGIVSIMLLLAHHAPNIEMQMIHSIDLEDKRITLEQLIEYGIVESYEYPAEGRWRAETRYDIKQPFMDWVQYQIANGPNYRNA